LPRDQLDRAEDQFYDATFLAADELMSKQKGRKALILLTVQTRDGYSPASSPASIVDVAVSHEV
jgi:hypothetical protein